MLSSRFYLLGLIAPLCYVEEGIFIPLGFIIDYGYIPLGFIKNIFNSLCLSQKRDNFAEK